MLVVEWLHSHVTEKMIYNIHMHCLCVRGPEALNESFCTWPDQKQRKLVLSFPKENNKQKQKQ